MGTSARVRIDAFPESAFRYRDRCPIVCVDVITSATTVVTAVAQGRRVFPAGNDLDVLRLAKGLADPLVAVDSPSAPPLPPEAAVDPLHLSGRADRRPVVLMDGAGTRLIANCHAARDVYVACLRNVTATVDYLASRHDEVVVLAAGEVGDFRCEDKMAAARIGQAFVEPCFAPEGQGTVEIIERWASVDVSLVGWGRSADHLRRAGRADVLHFILGHVDDLDVVCGYHEGEVTALGSRPRAAGVRPSAEREAAI